MINNFEAKIYEKTLNNEEIVLLKKLTREDNKRLSVTGFAGIVVIKYKETEKSLLLMKNKRDRLHGETLEYIKSEIKDLQRRIDRMASIAPTDTGIALLTNTIMKEIKRCTAFKKNKLKKSWQFYHDIEKRIENKFKQRNNGREIYNQIMQEENIKWI